MSTSNVAYIDQQGQIRNGGGGGVATDSISVHKSTFSPLKNWRWNEKRFYKAIHAWYSVVFRVSETCRGRRIPGRDASPHFRGWRVCGEDIYVWWYNDLTNSMEVSPSWEASSSAAHQEIPRFLWNRKIHYCPYPEPCQSVHAPSYLLKNHFNFILPSTPTYCKWSISHRCLHQTILYTSPLNANVGK
jgi:hypothetical protein